MITIIIQNIYKLHDAFCRIYVSLCIYYQCIFAAYKQLFMLYLKTQLRNGVAVWNIFIDLLIVKKCRLSTAPPPHPPQPVSCSKYILFYIINNHEIVLNDSRLTGVHY